MVSSGDKPVTSASPCGAAAEDAIKTGDYLDREAIAGGEENCFDSHGVEDFHALDQRRLSMENQQTLSMDQIEQRIFDGTSHQRLQRNSTLSLMSSSSATPSWLSSSIQRFFTNGGADISSSDAEEKADNQEPSRRSTTAYAPPGSKEASDNRVLMGEVNGFHDSDDETDNGSSSRIGLRDDVRHKSFVSETEDCPPSPNRVASGAELLLRAVSASDRVNSTQSDDEEDSGGDGFESEASQDPSCWFLSLAGLEDGEGIGRVRAIASDEEDRDKNSAREVAARIVLLRRMLPDLSGHLTVSGDSKSRRRRRRVKGQSGSSVDNEDQGDRKTYLFHLSGGYLRRSTAPPQNLNDEMTGRRRRPALTRMGSSRRSLTAGESSSEDSDPEVERCRKALSFLPPMPPEAAKKLKKKKMLKKKKKIQGDSVCNPDVSAAARTFQRRSSIGHVGTLSGASGGKLRRRSSMGPVGSFTASAVATSDAYGQRLLEAIDSAEYFNFPSTSRRHRRGSMSAVVGAGSSLAYFSQQQYGSLSRESSVSSDVSASVENEISSYFSTLLQWESRRVEDSENGDEANKPASLGVPAGPEVINGFIPRPRDNRMESTFLSCGWTLHSVPPLLTLDWTSALEATRRILRSRYWREAESQLTLLAGMLFRQVHEDSSFPSMTTIVPAEDVVESVRKKFRLPSRKDHWEGPDLSTELVTALVDAGMLHPRTLAKDDGEPGCRDRILREGFVFGRSVVQLCGMCQMIDTGTQAQAEVEADVEGGAQPLVQVEWSESAKVERLETHADDGDSRRDQLSETQVRQEGEEFHESVANRKQRRQRRGSVSSIPENGAEMGGGMPFRQMAPRRGSLYYDAVCKEEEVLPSSPQKVTPQAAFYRRESSRMMYMSGLTSRQDADVDRVVREWHLEHRRSHIRDAGGIRERLRKLRRSFDLLHLNPPVLPCDDESSGGSSALVTDARCFLPRMQMLSGMGQVSHAFPCYLSGCSVPQPCELWPQRPLLLRPTPSSGMKVRGIRFASSHKYLFLPGSGFCCGCTLPVNNGKERRGKSLVIDFETKLFRGTILVRMKNTKDAVVPMDSKDRRDYFSGRKRTLQFVVRGHFLTDDIPIVECVTGQLFDRPWAEGEVRPRWMLRSAMNFFSVVAPDQLHDFVSDQPRLVTTLACTADTITSRHRRKKSQSRVFRANESIEGRMVESQGSSSLLSAIRGELEGGPFTDDPAVLRQKRKTTFGKLFAARDKSATFHRDRVYTFEFHHQFVDFSNFSINVGPLGKHSLAGMLNGQPVKIMAAREGETAFADGTLEYLWCFDIWHENLVTSS